MISCNNPDSSEVMRTQAVVVYLLSTHGGYSIQSMCFLSLNPTSGQQDPRGVKFQID